MLKQTLISINNVLDELKQITQQDIADIKQANHDELFQRNDKKNELLQEFSQLKSQIDLTLVRRSESGLAIEQIMNNEENILLDEFKNKLNNFYEVHKKYAKMAILVTNFYNNLVNKVNNCEVDIGYKMTTTQYQANLSLKG